MPYTNLYVYSWWVWFWGVLVILVMGISCIRVSATHAWETNSATWIMGYLLQFPSLLRLTPFQKKNAGYTKTEALGILLVASIHKGLNLVNAKFQKHRFWNTPFLCLASSCLNWGQVGLLLVKGQWTKQLGRWSLQWEFSVTWFDNKYLYKHHLCLFTCVELLTSSFGFHAITTKNHDSPTKKLRNDPWIMSHREVTPSFSVAFWLFAIWFLWHEEMMS